MDAGRAASSDIASCSTPPGAGVSPGNDASGIINFGGGDGGGRGGETSVQASGQVDICRKISSPENEAPVKKNGPQMDFGTSVARTHVLESGHPVAECTSVLSDSPLIPEWAFEEQESSEASGGTISGSEKSPLSYVDLQGLDENGRLIPTWREDVREYAAARRRPPCERSSSSDFEDMSSSAVVRTQELDTRSGSHVASAPLSSATSVLFGAARGTNLESDEQNEFCTREMMSGVEALSNVLDRNSSPLPQLNRLEAGASLSFSTDAHTRETTAERNASIDYSTTRMLSTSVEDNSGSISINPSPHARAGHVSAPPGVNDLAADRGGPSNVLNQDALQRAIRGICSDRSLTENERDSRRQALFSRSYESKDAERVRAICRRYASIAFMKTYSKHVDPETGLSLLGCDHYPRNCKLKAACCGLIVPCRLCHDDPQFSMGHNIDRFATKEVLCMICLTLQPVSSHCVNCNTQFARHFCAKCRFYDNTPGKDIYHCDQCGICRVGKGLGQDNFHCTNCNACVSLDSQTSHKCLAKSLEANCPICYVYLFTSTEPVVFMRCGHTMHSRCFETYTKKNYTCPLCFKSLTNMQGYFQQIDKLRRQEVMPPELRNHLSDILCHDCDLKSTTAFHYTYHKCEVANGGCGGYNTRVLRAYVRADDNSVADTNEQPQLAAIADHVDELYDSASTDEVSDDSGEYRSSSDAADLSRPGSRTDNRALDDMEF